MIKKVNKKNSLDFFCVILILFVAIFSNNVWNQIRVLYWGSLMLIVFAHLFKNKGVINVKLYEFNYWNIAVLAMAFMSLIYTLDVGASMDVIKSMLVLFVVFCVSRSYMSDENKVQNVLIACFMAFLIDAVYILCTVDMDAIGEVQIGNALISGWNGNTIGMMAANGGVIGIWLMGRGKNYFYKLLYLIGTIVLLYTVVYTGSRGSLIFVVLSVIVYTIVSNPKKIILTLGISVILLFVVYQVCMNVESVYDILGVRLEGLFSFVTGEGEVDASTLRRELYIENGIKWIKESPFIGYGVNSYRVMNEGATGIYTYSHNNFIEIMINWGIMGFAIYYFAYMYIIVKLIKFSKNNKLCSIVFAMMVAEFVCHISVVTYIDFFQNLLLCVGFVLIFINKNQEKKDNIQS